MRASSGTDGSNRQEEGHTQQEGRGIGSQRPASPDRDHEHTGDHRTEDRKAATRERKKGVRLLQSLPRNGLGDKARRGRPEEGVADAVDERERDEMPEPRRPANQ